MALLIKVEWFYNETVQLLSLKDVKKLHKSCDLFGYFEIMHYLCTKNKMK